MKQLKVYFIKKGDHYHCRVFMGVHGQTFTKVGDLIFSADDFKNLPGVFAHSTIFIEDSATTQG